MLRISAEILHQPLELRRCCSGDKGRAAPVMQHCSGQLRIARRQILDDQLAPPQPRLIRRDQGAGSRLARCAAGQPRLQRSRHNY